MAYSRKDCMRVVLLAALAVLLAASSCGKGHGERSLSATGALPPAKSASIPPEGTANEPWDVLAQQNGSQLAVSWRGHNIGDYDLDRTVGVADITPIAMNFGAAVEYVGGVPVESGNNEYLACIDGDGNGSIGVSDITPIAQHFGASCAGYRLYLGLRATGETEITWDASFEAPPGNPTSQVTVAFNESRMLSEVQRYSFSFTAPTAFDGFAKIRVVATDGTEEGAFTESGEFAVNTLATDTTPPYNTGGLQGLSVAAKPGRALLSWGVWEDAQSPPVEIEIIWSVAPLDTANPENDRLTVASGQIFPVDSLTNDTTYEFACRFRDQAVPPNYTNWLSTVQATPSAHLYALPPTGAEDISLTAGLSPSVDSFPDADAVHDAYAPMVAYISAGGGDAGQLIFARYDDGAWSTENVSTNTFSACSILAAGDAPVIMAAGLTPSPNVMRFWNDAELSGWSSEVVFGSAVSNLKTMRNESDAQHPYVFFTTVGANPRVHASRWIGSSWFDSLNILATGDSILDLSLAMQPGDSMLQVLVTHGTVNPQQAQISSTIACYEWDTASSFWFYNGDFALTNDGSGNARAAFSTSFWPAASPLFLGSASAIRIVPTTIFTYTVDVPYGDTLGMDPSNFAAQPDWAEIKKGTTGINLMPLGLTLNWYVEPRWTEGSDSIVFVNVAGTINFTLNPFTITGGSLAPSWWAADFSGGIWTAQALTIGGNSIPTGRAQEMAPAPPGASGSFQMVYTQLDTIDVSSLLGGGSLPTGNIYYARK